MAADDLWVVPGVRGCIWLLQRSDVSLALKVSDLQARRRIQRDMAKLDVPEQHLHDLGAAAAEALAGGAVTPDALRSALPDGLVRSLGEPGKKLGHPRAGGRGGPLHQRGPRR